MGAHRLDISLETQALFIRYRDPSAQEAQEEHERMSAVLSDDVRDDGDNSDMLVEYIDGEWQLHGRVPTSRETSLGSSHAGSLRGTPNGSAGRRTPLANSPHDSPNGSRSRTNVPELPT